MALILDIETTGLPTRISFGKYHPYKKLDAYASSRIVQMSFMLCDDDFVEVAMEDFVIKADGFKIGVSPFHKITDDISTARGVPLSEAFDAFEKYLVNVSHIIAHNADFDVNIVKSELFRLGKHDLIQKIEQKVVMCTMAHTKAIVSARNAFGLKNPSLSELYSFACKEPIANEHDSLFDVKNLHKAIKTLYDSGSLNYNQKIIYSQILSNNFQSV